MFSLVPETLLDYGSINYTAQHKTNNTFNATGDFEALLNLDCESNDRGKLWRNCATSLSLRLCSALLFSDVPEFESKFFSWASNNPVAKQFTRQDGVILITYVNCSI